ncbi:hypothetical protein K438DRAFT_1982190 [Mycena galopus ATCC 62051]|nr:hypothetical protein K438DRAFT_1982190 [Mycena galopus ATCC 62051]
MHRRNSDRQKKALGTARSTFTLNPDFGYFNSQVSDQDAFRHYLNGPTGEKTQAELLELSQDTTAGYVELGGSILRSDADQKPITVKIEKENYPLTPAVLRAFSPGRSSTKRARVEEDHTVKIGDGSVPGVIEPVPTDRLRISLLEAEIANLRTQMLLDQQGFKHAIRELQQDWHTMRQDCINCQARVGGLKVRMDRVEGHIDEMVVHLPGHHGWRSEVGSEYDPDTTLAEVEVEDGSQPLDWTQGQDWLKELDEDEKEGIATTV